MEYGEGYLLASRSGDLGERRELPQRGPPWLKTHYRVFWRPQTLLFAPICRCFEFVKQCFMSNLEGKAEVWGQLPPPLPQRYPWHCR